MTTTSTSSTPAPTALDICNIALSKLGESPISVIDANGTPAERLCYMHYHPARREVLCANSWSFASKLTELSCTGEPATSEGYLEHALPADCLRVLRISAPSWTMRGRSVFCPGETVRMLYIRDEENTAIFEPLFIEALSARLACKLCIPLTSSTTARQALTEEYHRIALPQAAHFNGVQAASNDTHPLYRLWRQSLCHNGDTH